MERIKVAGLSEEVLCQEIRRRSPIQVGLEDGREVQFVAIRELGGKLMVVFRDGLHERGQGAIATEPEEAMVPLTKVVTLLH